MERKPVLVVKKLCKYFGGIRAINNIDLELFENEIIGIVGDNGAGKSTLIKTISGLYERNAGLIYINDEEADIHNPNDARRYGIETVYQDRALVVNQTIVRNNRTIHRVKNYGILNLAETSSKLTRLYASVFLTHGLHLCE